MTTDPLALAAELGSVYARMSGLLLDEQTIQRALEIITELSLETIDGAESSGITLIDNDGHKESAAANDDLTRRADELQYELNEGPCIDSWRDRVLVRIDNLEEDFNKWPRWGPAAYDLGVRASISAPLLTGNRCLGATKVYARRGEVFSEKAADVLMKFGEQAAILLSNVQSLTNANKLSESLQRALEARNSIIMATGIVMERYHLSEDEAFLKLVELAGLESLEVVDSALKLLRSTSRRQG